MVTPLRALVFVLAGSMAAAQAQSSAEHSVDAWNITAECQMVVLPQKLALPLIPELLDDSKIEVAYAKVQEMIAKGEAQLAANLLGRAKNEERFVAETIEEMRYGTEFDPPQLPDNAPENPAILKDWPITGITPTAFETRSIGTTVELQVKVLEGARSLSVAVSPQHTRFLRWTKTDAGKLANGERLVVEQPVFHVAKSTTSVMVRNGQRILLGVHKVPDAPDAMELFLLKVQAIPVSIR